MKAKRSPSGGGKRSFGMGQHGGERLEIEQGGRHGQPEKGDVAREPRQGGAGSGPRARSSRTPKKK